MNNNATTNTNTNTTTNNNSNNNRLNALSISDSIPLTGINSNGKMMLPLSSVGLVSSASTSSIPSMSSFSSILPSGSLSSRTPGRNMSHTRDGKEREVQRDRGKVVSPRGGTGVSSAMSSSRLDGEDKGQLFRKSNPSTLHSDNVVTFSPHTMVHSVSASAIHNNNNNSTHHNDFSSFNKFGNNNNNNKNQHFNAFSNSPSASPSNSREKSKSISGSRANYVTPTKTHRHQRSSSGDSPVLPFYGNDRDRQSSSSSSPKSISHQHHQQHPHHLGSASKSSVRFHLDSNNNNNNNNNNNVVYDISNDDDDASLSQTDDIQNYNNNNDLQIFKPRARPLRRERTSESPSSLSKSQQQHMNNNNNNNDFSSKHYSLNGSADQMLTTSSSSSSSAAAAAASSSNVPKSPEGRALRRTSESLDQEIRKNRSKSIPSSFYHPSSVSSPNHNNTTPQRNNNNNNNNNNISPSSSPTHSLASLSSSNLNINPSDMWIIKSNELNVPMDAEPLGKGFFGEVRLGTWRSVPVACKFLFEKSFRDKSDHELFMQEVNILRSLRHPNVILYMGVVLDNKYRIIVTEYMERGTLYSWLMDRKLKYSTILKISHDIALGMNYLHGENILHRDLTSKNILLNRHLEAKVSDFGLSKMKIEEYTNSSTMGSVAWMAPEVLLNARDFTKKSDVYSFGVLIWQLFSGQDPCPNDLAHVNLTYKVIHEGFRPHIPTGIPLVWKNLIDICWAQDPDERPTFETILEYLHEIEVNPPPSPVPSSPTASRSSGSTSSSSNSSPVSTPRFPITSSTNSPLQPHHQSQAPHVQISTPRSLPRGSGTSTPSSPRKHIHTSTSSSSTNQNSMSSYFSQNSSGNLPSPSVSRKGSISTPPTAIPTSSNAATTTPSSASAAAPSLNTIRTNSSTGSVYSSSDLSSSAPTPRSSSTSIPTMFAKTSSANASTRSSPITTMKTYPQHNSSNSNVLSSNPSSLSSIPSPISTIKTVQNSNNNNNNNNNNNFPSPKRSNNKDDDNDEYKTNISWCDDSDQSDTCRSEEDRSSPREQAPSSSSTSTSTTPHTTNTTNNTSTFNKSSTSRGASSNSTSNQNLFGSKPLKSSNDEYVERFSHDESMDD
eukprot:TRINITY_DN1132_c0_g2_i1.p1 TRINITY_DN1132_c0_g2~~TRINITY_DN1132_c0_g2_i1.p1  ORF type:complete len:1224 (+),score=464.66 TRINITY_DN1132_c0_g2_i1:336-3674(+)